MSSFLSGILLVCTFGAIGMTAANAQGTENNMHQAPGNTGPLTPAAETDGKKGVLLWEGHEITATDLFNPSTGKVLLITGAPLQPPPPHPSSTRRIGIIDSGVLPDHPQLRNLVVAMKDFTGSDPIDRIGHGTAVALLAVAAYYEWGWGRELTASVPGRQRAAVAAGIFAAGSPAVVSAKVTDPQGHIDLKHVIEAIHWMATQGVSDVNLSLGFTGSPGRYAELCNAIAQYSDRPGSNKSANVMRFATAAGNFGPDVPVYPAACKVPNLVAVGRTEHGKIWEHSGRADVYAAPPEERGIVFVRPEVYHWMAADAAARSGDVGAARQGYRASLAIQENGVALFRLAMLDLNDGNLDAAHAGLARALELETRDPLRALNESIIEEDLGVVRLRQNKPEEGLAHLDRALALNLNMMPLRQNEPELGLKSGNVHIRVNRARALFKLGRPEDALQELLAARELSDDKAYIDWLIASWLIASLPAPYGGSHSAEPKSK